MDVTNVLKRGLIVSCQALENEPLHSSFIMSKMAYAAKLGGAIAIRANTFDDITAIKNATGLPVIGIVKRCYADSDVYITPTMKEADEVAVSGAEIISLDATLRKRPFDESLADLVKNIRKKYPEKFIMADISTLEEAQNACTLGFDLISTTLSSYTEYTKGRHLPDLDLLEEIVKATDIPVIAEGGIWTIDDLASAVKKGAYAAVIGTAITRPLEITRRYVKSLIDIGYIKG